MSYLGIVIVLVLVVLTYGSQATDDVIFDVDHNLKNHYPIVEGGVASTYSIVGAGPVGLYLSLRLLEEDPLAKVELYEARKDFTRTQCLRLPYENARKIPEDLKNKLWPNEKVRGAIFSNKTSKDSIFWPYPNYQHYPRISVGNFQTHLLNHLKSTKFEDRFTFQIKKVDINDVKKWFDENKPIFITSGYAGLNIEVRTHYSSEKNPVVNKIGNYDHDNFGLYLIYNNSEFEYYEKTSREKLGAHGLTYSATNNEYRQVQFYTYPKATFTSFYDTLPFKCENATFPNALDFNNPSEKFPWSDKTVGLKWLDDFKNELVAIASQYGVKFPQNAKLHCAPRKEYAFKKIASENHRVVFFGDSVGGTDFKYGLNLGRGLLAAEFFVENLKKNSFYETTTLYQEYWDKIMNKEFKSFENNIADLIADPWIFFKYVVMGRIVDDVLQNESTFSDYESIILKKIKR